MSSNPHVLVVIYHEKLRGCLREAHRAVTLRTRVRNASGIPGSCRGRHGPLACSFSSPIQSPPAGFSSPVPAHAIRVQG